MRTNEVEALLTASWEEIGFMGKAIMAKGSWVLLLLLLQQHLLISFGPFPVKFRRGRVTCGIHFYSREIPDLCRTGTSQFHRRKQIRDNYNKTPTLVLH